MAVWGMLLAMTACLVLGAVLQPLLAARTQALAAIESSDSRRSPSADTAHSWKDDGSGDAPVSTVVTRTAAARNLTIRRIEPAAQATTLLIEKADFNDLVRWIAQLESEEGLRVVTIDMDRTTDPGIVNATMAVRR